MLLTVADKLLFILFYFKFYPTQEVQGFLFGISQPQANVWIHVLTPALNRALGAEQHLPARKTRSVTQLRDACPGLEFIIDGTQRAIRRPQDAARQKGQRQRQEKAPYASEQRHHRQAHRQGQGPQSDRGRQTA